MSQTKSQLVAPVGILTVSEISVTGVVTATSFVGDGSGLTGVGIGTDGSVNTTGIITATSFVGDGSGLSGVGPSSQNVTSVSGITTVDLSAGSVIYFTHDTDTTVAFANTSTTQELTFIRQKDATTTPRTLTWPNNIRWNRFGYVPPTLFQNESSSLVVSLVTRDGGANWFGWEEQYFEGNNLRYLFAFGYNVQGQLGQNNTTPYSSPVQIPGTTWSSISGGSQHSLATKTDGTLWSWGYNTNGSLGQNNTTFYSSPVQIPGTTWSSISCKGSNALATKTDGTLWVWGVNNNGQLGQNDITNYSSPVQIPGTTWSSISGGSGGHSLATKTDGTLWAWGPNFRGQLGQNSVTSFGNGLSSPVQIPGNTWSSIDAGEQHSLATKTDGTLWSWGYNNVGHLGQNNRTSYSSPVQIPGNTWSSISGGGSGHSLATKTDGTLWAWGYNSYGILGQNDGLNRSSPVQIPGIGWSSISAGLNQSLAIANYNII